MTEHLLKMKISRMIRTSPHDHRVDEVGGLGKVRVDRVVLEIDGGHAEESVSVTLNFIN